MAFLLLAGWVPVFSQVQAGAGKRTITPDLARHAPVYLAGFDQNRVATGIHDELFARCLALRAGGTPLVLCGVDSIGLFLDDIERIRAAARAQLGGPIDIVVASTHDHEAPDTMGLWGPAMGVSGINEEYNRYVAERTADAAFEAVRSLAPARLTLARSHSAELDGFVNDTRPPVVHDSELVMLSAARPGGKRIATLVNWANHPEALGSKNTLVTADYPAFLCKRLEERLGGLAVFMNGAVGGMQSPLGAKVKDPATGAPAAEDSFRFAELIGTRVADLAAGAVQAAKPAAVDRVEYRSRTIMIPLTNAGYVLAAKAGVFKGRKVMSAEGTTTAVGAVRLSHQGKPVLEIALVPGELYPELSVGGVARYAGADYPEAPIEPAIKRNTMKAPFRMLFGLANDEIGYIIPTAEWDEKEPWLQNRRERWYGEVNSVGPDAAPRICGALEDLFRAGLR